MIRMWTSGEALGTELIQRDLERGRQRREERRVMIDEDVGYQALAGFGGAFNELGWEALGALDEAERSSVLGRLFGGDGCRFSLCRVPVGASDFALDAYTPADVDGDWDMKAFSIERDKLRLIPYLRAAKVVNPELRIWACPWSPPYWLKTNRNMCSGGELMDDPRVYRAYALYLRTFLEAYEAEGLPFMALCPQNETDVINVYPTCTMTSEAMTKFLRAYFIPLMVEKYGRDMATELWVGTIRDMAGYAEAVLADPVVRQFVKGAGFQYSTSGVVHAAAEGLPALSLYHTESPCHNGANSWDEAFEIFDDVLMYLRSGCRNYSYWNMILDSDGYSSWGWKQNSLISIDKRTRKVVYNPECSVMEHFSRFVDIGARRVACSAVEDERIVAFKNPDGKVVIVVANPRTWERDIFVAINKERHSIALKPRSLTTVVLGD